MDNEETLAVDGPERLRALASWYRDLAERAGNPAIWDSRLRTAEELERKAARLETWLTARPCDVTPPGF